MALEEIVLIDVSASEGRALANITAKSARVAFAL